MSYGGRYSFYLREGERTAGRAAVRARDNCMLAESAEE
jgi:hypothetical protein